MTKENKNNVVQMLQAQRVLAPYRVSAGDEHLTEFLLEVSDFNDKLRQVYTTEKVFTALTTAIPNPDVAGQRVMPWKMINNMFTFYADPEKRDVAVKVDMAPRVDPAEVSNLVRQDKISPQEARQRLLSQALNSDSSAPSTDEVSTGIRSAKAVVVTRDKAGIVVVRSDSIDLTEAQRKDLIHQVQNNLNLGVDDVVRSLQVEQIIKGRSEDVIRFAPVKFSG